MHIFLDEVGNFKGDKNDYFVVGGFVTGEPRATAKAFRKWQHGKFRNKKLQYRTEVKFSDTRLTDELRAKTLLYLTQQNIRIFYSYLKNKNIPLDFRNKRGIETGHLYAEVVAKTLDLLFPVADNEYHLTLDRRRLKGLSQSEFREFLHSHLLPNVPAKSAIYINLVDSTTSTNIQIADWICGALYRYYANRQNGEKFYKTLHSSIIASTELFEDYWENLHKQDQPQHQSKQG